MPEKSSVSSLSKLLKLIDKYRIDIFLSSALSAASVITQLYVPILFGEAIDELIGIGKIDMSVIISYLYRIMIYVAISALCSYLMSLVNNRISYGTVNDIRERTFRHIQNLPLKYLDGHSTGDIVGRVIADADQLSDGLLLGFSQLFAGVVTIIVTLYFMFSRNIEITIMVILLTPLSFLVARFIARRSYQMFVKQNETRGKQTALINEMISNEKILKAFGYEKRASEKFRRINADLKKYSQSATFYSSLTNPSTRAVNNLIYALVALVGAYKILGGSLTVGGLSVLLSYANQYTKPFNDISSVITELQNSLSCADRIFELLEVKPQSTDPEKQLSVKQGAIDINNVCFSYQKDQKLIEDFNFHADPGMTIAIVGPTGCGKTTLINLLMRFYDVNKGEIYVDEQEIRSVSRSSLRKSYGMVLQDTWLKKASVRDNIAFGKPEASDEEIIEAAKKTHSYEFIRRMKDGLDTIIDDDSLSQGQKQLLCITRVMLCMPPMLILDEATSSIDTRTEIFIQKAFNQLMEGKTSFIVAHRLSTIRNADKILVMRNGQIIEQGNHDELMKAKGFYFELYNSQFAGKQL
ncbi:MAG: ABC transporter ATP-binding protein [Erysipelotrichaceae bacterium]|nr:ABC transporter ATP-binding protein [Erysipelotrichaceae bacterium]